MATDRDNLRTSSLIALQLIIGLVVQGCTTTGTVVVPQSESAKCSNMMPAVALKERNISVNVANTAIQQLAVGKLETKYESTVKTLLSDETTREWVRVELVCQSSKGFADESRRLWYVTMREVASKGSSDQLLQWLNENPVNSFSPDKAPEHLRKSPSIESINIESVNGTVRLPENLVRANIKLVEYWGDLYVPGRTTVVIDECHGDIYYSSKAAIVIKKAGYKCNQQQY